MVVPYRTTLGFPNLKMIILGWWNGGIPPPYTPSLPPSVLFHRSTSHLFSPYHQPSLALANPQHPKCEWSLPIHPGGSINRHRWCRWSSKLIKMLIWATTKNVWNELYTSLLVSHKILVFDIGNFIILAIPDVLVLTTAPWSPQAAHIFCCDNCSLQRHVWSFNRARSTVENKNVRFKMAN